MNIFIKKMYLGSLAGAFALLFAQAAFAQSTPPVVSSLSVSPSYVASGASTTVSWVGAWTAVGGVDLYFNCPSGVTFAVGSTAFPCNQSQAASSNLSDSVAFTVSNQSGSQQYVTITAYPKDSNGADYPAGAQSTLLLVGAAAKPLSGLSFSASTTASNTPLTISWIGNDAAGTNIEFSCTQGVQISTASGTVPCNAPISSVNLAASGSQVVTLTNISNQAQTITAYVVPAIASGAFDMTRAISALITVEPASWQAAPSVTSFTSPQSTIASGVPFSVSWSTSNAAGANIEFICTGQSVSLVRMVGTTSVAVPCNTPIFTPALSATGSTTFAATIQTSATGILLELIPQNTDGTYLGTAAQNLSLTVAAQGGAAVAPAASPAPSSTKSVHYTFTRTLVRGSSNADVTALQKFLALDASIYPNGQATGYFGAATQKAVELFQIKYSIAKAGDAGYGSVGPKTRAVLNSLQ